MRATYRSSRIRSMRDSQTNAPSPSLQATGDIMRQARTAHPGLTGVGLLVEEYRDGSLNRASALVVVVVVVVDPNAFA